MQRTVRLVKPMGLIPYVEGLKLQQKLFDECKEFSIDSLVILQHTPVYTAGRRKTGFAMENSKRLSQFGAETYDVSMNLNSALNNF
jgi:lipoate-protein ligase B